MAIEDVRFSIFAQANNYAAVNMFGVNIAWSKTGATDPGYTSTFFNANGYGFMNYAGTHTNTGTFVGSNRMILANGSGGRSGDSLPGTATGTVDASSWYS